mmetsp:Transcript_16231/g.63289  ORF Transcript_16231/g.63289 Transcript_16231/m.63289 type:complete len:218 (-) Transcript_16231:1025-1678(-)
MERCTRQAPEQGLAAIPGRGGQDDEAHGPSADQRAQREQGGAAVRHALRAGEEDVRGGAGDLSVRGRAEGYTCGEDRGREEERGGGKEKGTLTRDTGRRRRRREGGGGRRRPQRKVRTHCRPRVRLRHTAGRRTPAPVRRIPRRPQEGPPRSRHQGCGEGQRRLDGIGVRFGGVHSGVHSCGDRLRSGGGPAHHQWPLCRPLHSLLRVRSSVHHPRR